MNLPLLKRDIKLVLQFISNGAAGDRAEHLAVIASLHFDDRSQLGNAASQFAHAIELMRFALGAALPENFNLALVRGGEGNRQALRKEIVASVAGSDLYLVRLGAEADDVVR